MAELPNGHIIFTADAGPIRGTFQPPMRFFVYDPESNIISQISTPFDDHLDNIHAYETRLLVLPTGQILYGDMQGIEMWVFTADGTAPGALRPKVDDVVVGPSGSNSYTIIGRQLNGVSAGSSYGDDVESDENYPIVSLTARDGFVFYATTSNWSNTDSDKKGVQTVDSPSTRACPMAGIGWSFPVPVSGPSRSASDSRPIRFVPPPTTDPSRARTITS